MLQQLLDAHNDFEEEITRRQPEYDDILRHSRRLPSAAEPSGAAARRRTASQSARSKKKETPKPEETKFRNPRVNDLHAKWLHLWLLTMERRRRLQETLDHMNEVGAFLALSVCTFMHTLSPLLSGNRRRAAPASQGLRPLPFK